MEVHGIQNVVVIDKIKIMKIIRNNLIPLKGFIAINLFGVLFVRGDKTLSQQTVVHERIHTKQMQEMLYVFFYFWYVLEWLIRLLVIHNPHKAYRAISFEQEARAYQQYIDYPDCRHHYSWAKYLTKQWSK